MIPQISLVLGRSPQRWVTSHMGDYKLCRALRLPVLQESEHIVLTFQTSRLLFDVPLLKLCLIPTSVGTPFILSIMS